MGPVTDGESRPFRVRQCITRSHESVHADCTRIVTTPTPAAASKYQGDDMSAHGPDRIDPAGAWNARPCSRGFDAMLVAYRATGGIARGDNLARLLQECGRGDYVGLARLIVSRAVFAFRWHDMLWIPMFQFRLRDLAIRSGNRQVLAEIPADVEGWALAAWFARPNGLLNDEKPVDLLDADLPAVLNAARAERFVGAG